MIRFIPRLALISFASIALSSSALAVDDARAIVNGIDPKSMNELIDMARTQRDAALTSVTPTSGNRFRFLFIWPASNPVMTYERIGQSFAERFLKFAQSQSLLAEGYCLLSKNLSFGTTAYGSETVNVAYRDVEVRFLAGASTPCPGRYIPASDVEKDQGPAANPPGFGSYPPVRASPSVPSPDGGLSPFLRQTPSQ